MKKSVLVILALAVVVMMFLARPDLTGRTPAAVGLPWHIDVHPDGTASVFGLTLGVSTLGDARARFGEEAGLALMSGDTGDLRLEMFFDRFQAGPLTGKLLVRADLETAALATMRAGAVKVEVLPSGGRRYLLGPEQRRNAFLAPIRRLSFYPSAALDAEIVVKIFGTAAEKVSSGEQVVHWLYPARGLDVILAEEGRDVLVYVEPRRFAILADAVKGENPGGREGDNRTN